jgi:hypothetical protein
MFYYYITKTICVRIFRYFYLSETTKTTKTTNIIQIIAFIFREIKFDSDLGHYPFEHFAAIDLSMGAFPLTFVRSQSNHNQMFQITDTWKNILN